MGEAIFSVGKLDAWRSTVFDDFATNILAWLPDKSNMGISPASCSSWLKLNYQYSSSLRSLFGGPGTVNYKQ